jgi:peptide/nickel transport system substrate-binding protein
VQQFRADLQEYDWTSLNPDPGLFLQYWTCAQAAQKANNWSGYSSSRWCSPAYDALYQQSATELDPEKRAAIFIQMNDMLSEDVALIPLVRQARVSGVSARLQGLAPTPWDTDAWNIQDWSMAAP